MAKTLSKREKTIFIVTVSVILLSLIFHFVISPVMNDDDLLNKELLTVRIKLKKYLRLLSQQPAIEARYKQFSSAFNIKENQDDKVVEVLLELERLAKIANIRIVDIRPSQNTASKSGDYKEMLVDLRAEGTMKGYLRFLYEIENSLFLLRVKKLQFNAKANSAALEGAFSISQLAVSK